MVNFHIWVLFKFVSYELESRLKIFEIFVWVSTSTLYYTRSLGSTDARRTTRRKLIGHFLARKFTLPRSNEPWWLIRSFYSTLTTKKNEFKKKYRGGSYRKRFLTTILKIVSFRRRFCLKETHYYFIFLKYRFFFIFSSTVSIAKL